MHKHTDPEYDNLESEYKSLNNKILILHNIICSLRYKINNLKICLGNLNSTNFTYLCTYYDMIRNYNSIDDNELVQYLTDENPTSVQQEKFNNFGYQKYIERLGELDKKMVDSLDVILVSASFYNEMCIYLKNGNYTVNRLIIDECNSIQGSQLIDIERVFTWLITSSIKSLMTNTGFIYNLGPINQYNYQPRIHEKTIFSTGIILETIKAIYNNITENYKLFLINDPVYVEQSIKLPEYFSMILTCKDNANIQILNGVVSHDIMKMLNAGDIDGIITKLDCTISTENNVVSLITQKYQDDIKLKEYALQIAVNRPNYDPKKETDGTKNIRIAIKDLKHKIECIEERIMSIESCPICYDNISNPCITKCCSNKFCFDCITMALNAKQVCPQCRTEISISQLIILDNGERIKSDMPTESVLQTPINYSELTYTESVELIKNNASNFTKYENMDAIFKMNSKNDIKKILIFTEYESTLNSKITSILDKHNLTYGRLRGTGATIAKCVENYKTGNTNVLLINSRCFGSGINLENTSDIIILHKMNSDLEMQVIGRAQRYGRVGNLRIWKLYYLNEM
jgi:hypothetical protein